VTSPTSIPHATWERPGAAAARYRTEETDDRLHGVDGYACRALFLRVGLMRDKAHT